MIWLWTRSYRALHPGLVGLSIGPKAELLESVVHGGGSRLGSRLLTVKGQSQSGGSLEVETVQQHKWKCLPAGRRVNDRREREDQ
jgi:hypothetical protein